MYTRPVKWHKTQIAQTNSLVDQTFTREARLETELRGYRAAPDTGMRYKDPSWIGSYKVDSKVGEGSWLPNI